MSQLYENELSSENQAQQMLGRTERDTLNRDTFTDAKSLVGSESKAVRCDVRTENMRVTAQKTLILQTVSY